MTVNNLPGLTLADRVTRDHFGLTLADRADQAEADRLEQMDRAGRHEPLTFPSPSSCSAGDDASGLTHRPGSRGGDRVGRAAAFRAARPGTVAARHLRLVGDGCEVVDLSVRRRYREQHAFDNGPAAA